MSRHMLYILSKNTKKKKSAIISDLMYSSVYFHTGHTSCSWYVKPHITQLFKYMFSHTVTKAGYIYPLLIHDYGILLLLQTVHVTFDEQFLCMKGKGNTEWPQEALQPLPLKCFSPLNIPRMHSRWQQRTVFPPLCCNVSQVTQCL